MHTSRNLKYGSDAPLRVLRVDGSGRYDGSISRALSDDLIAALQAHHGDIEVTVRDLARGLPFVGQDWIVANFTDASQRDHQQQAQLACSDRLVKELQDADIVVIGIPVYNFTIPATVKAWVDMVARARLTFRYTDQGPQGLLRGKRAFLVVVSGGVSIDSAVDFATPYMRHVLGFLGITDVEVIAAEKLNTQGQTALKVARERIHYAASQFTGPRPKAQAA